jgi:ABC-2 type transport system ATP-binding protein
MKLVVDSLTKKYGDFYAVKTVSFTAKTGKILALLGPNGAGKTTTLRMLSSYFTPDSGDVFLDDVSLYDDTKSYQKILGYLPEHAPLYSELTVYEHLIFSAQVHSVEKNRYKSAVQKVSRMCSLEEKLFEPVSSLSKGYRQRVALAQALIHDPKILILDEPTTGLDPNQIRDIRALIKELGKTKIVILSTHIMQEVEAIADQVVLLHKGVVKASGDLSDILHGKEEGRFCISVTASGKKKIISSLFSSIESVVKVVNHGDEYEVYANTDVRKLLLKACAENDIDVLEIKEKDVSMENVFYTLTQE